MAKGYAKCGVPEALVFIAALICGTGCSLSSKVLLDYKAQNINGEDAAFEKPLFQTFTMFLGMVAALPIHFAIVYFKFPFPGYPRFEKSKSKDDKEQPDDTESPSKGPNKRRGSKTYQSFKEEDDAEPEKEGFSWKVFLLLIFPAAFDLGATALAMLGLKYVHVSVYQLLRGSSIIFVAVIKHFWIGDKQKKYMWIGIFWIITAVTLVALASVFEGSGGSAEESKPLVGVGLVVAGAFVQSLEFAFEEQAMSERAIDPLLLSGVEGVWGSLLCMIFVYPIAYFAPGGDNGSIEDPFDTWFMLTHSSILVWLTVLYVSCIFCYNVLCVITTSTLDSVWTAILDNFRPVTVWIGGLFLYYVAGHQYGEKWTVWSWIQLGAIGCLLYGTALYNAPTKGSIKLQGRPWDCFIDCSEEYEDVKKKQDEQEEGSKPIKDGK